MPRENAVTRAIAGKAKQGPAIWIEGRHILYRSSMAQNPEVKERGGRWDGKHQCWRLPRLTRDAAWLIDYDPDATPTRDVKRVAKGDWEAVDAEVFQGVDPDIIPIAYGRLYPYQRLAAQALVTRPYHGTMLVLSPGLGKTPTSIVAADMLLAKQGDAGKVLVVAPLMLVRNWVREINAWSGTPAIELVHGEGPAWDDPSVRWTVTNPDTCLERVKDPTTNRWTVTGNLRAEYDEPWDLVIFDESVLYKNRKSKRSMMARSLSSKAHKVWELTGAPTTKDNSDLWQQLNIVEPDYFSSFWRYANQACIVVQTPWSKGEIIGSRKSFIIRNEFPEMLFVRNQEEVFDDLPETIFVDVELPLNKRQAKAHKDVMDDWIHSLEENPNKQVEVTAVIAMLIRLQQITSNLYNLETTGTEWPDDSSKADWVEETLSETGEVEWPVLIWTHHRPGAKALLDRLRKKAKKKDSMLHGKRVELVYGGMGKRADEIIEDYKAGKVDVLILGITVGKYGHTLAISKTIVTYDKTWDSDAWFQMLHRFGGARAKLAGYHHKPLVLNPRCRGTVDDFIELNLAGKLPDMASITGADLAKILRSLGEDHVALAA